MEGFPDRHTGFRVFEVITLIRAGAYPSVRSIAEKFECSRRTAERYIEKVRDLVACDLIFDREKRGYRFIEGGPDLPAFRLSEGEAAAVFLAAKLLDQCRGTPYEAAVRRALSKLAYVFPRAVTLDSLVQPLGWVTFRVESLRGDERQVMEAFLLLEEARRQRRTVRLRYFTASRGEGGARKINPYHLHFHEGVWYLFGLCHWRGEVKIFALDRMDELELTDEPFEVPGDFSPEGFMADSFRIERGAPADVTIRFQPGAARYMRGKQWHPSQSIEELPEGGLILRMRVGGLGEVRRWILSLGAGAEVLEPEELRKGVAEEVRRLVLVYGGATEPRGNGMT